ncbi:DUF262 domain-containing protein [Diaphorobacter sp.]|uniref:DUF262 domain-containing protein n=1 Tax=Diaphorobacter sp. TaxID=1934310 RepID=UPI003D10E10B
MLSLRDIAAWQFPQLAQGMKNDRPPIVAAIPSLQRGAVWKPQQVELLWDSILRGFPIGALVVSKVLKNQQSHPGKHGTGWGDGISHHLLDGQQRCNAIALGFQDPFDNTDSAPHTALWLDIAPEGHFAHNSSRAFLLRLCTTAHPWGYGTQDTLEKLSAHQVREALRDDYDWKQQPQDDDYQRPRPKDTWPHKAGVPVPLAWLLQGAASPDLWGHLRQRLTRQFPINTLHSRHWARKAWNFLQPAIDGSLHDLAQALRATAHVRVVALTVPPEALSRPTRQETQQHDQPPLGEQRIANVEHLFQRLNAGGTELRGDELLYSMIKAYWPGIETTIDLLPRRPPATQVALLGTRVALTDAAQDKPRGPLGISQLRAIAPYAPMQAATQDAQELQRQGEELRIQHMFALHANAAPGAAEIARILTTVDGWLLYDAHANPWGLPPVLRSRMAEQCPEMFYFLMLLARASLQQQMAARHEKAVRRRLLGLATAVHWFGGDAPAAVRKLWEMKPLAQWLTPQSFDGVLAQLKDLGDGRSGIIDLRSPRGLAKIVEVPQASTLQDWNWWNTLIVAPAQGDADKQAERHERYWPLLEKLPYCEPLLMYCQRRWMAQRFGDYDRHLDNGYWDDHNRPWDFDHILPQKMFSDVRSAKYLRVCQQWGYTIGNLHILRFEENRSRQDSPATESIADAHLDMAWLRDGDKDLRPAFSISREDVRGGTDEQRNKVLGFVRAACTRMLRLYEEWYTQLDIERML